jgi:hypothetical protein
VFLLCSTGLMKPYLHVFVASEGERGRLVSVVT